MSTTTTTTPTKIAVPKEEYQRLKQIAKRYDTIRNVIESDFFAEPPTKNVKKIVSEFRKTELYNESFLQALGKGLKESFASR